MALQTTGLEFFYLSVDFFENDKILLVEQELGSRATQSQKQNVRLSVKNSSVSSKKKQRRSVLLQVYCCDFFFVSAP